MPADIQAIVEEFTQNLLITIFENLQGGTSTPKKNGSHPSPTEPPPALAAEAPKKKRKRGPVQMCPVPGCKNRAAPVFNMVCSDHKSVSKKKIAAYREERRRKNAARERRRQ